MTTDKLSKLAEEYFVNSISIPEEKEMYKKLSEEKRDEWFSDRHFVMYVFKKGYSARDEEVRLLRKQLKEECYCMGEKDYEGKVIICGCCTILEATKYE